MRKIVMNNATSDSPLWTMQPIELRVIDRGSASVSSLGKTRFPWWCHDMEILSKILAPDSKFHGANMGPIWGRQDPGGPHVGPMNFAIWGPYVRQIHHWLVDSPYKGPVVQTSDVFFEVRLNKLLNNSWSASDLRCMKLMWQLCNGQACVFILI